MRDILPSIDNQDYNKKFNPTVTGAFISSEHVGSTTIIKYYELGQIPADVNSVLNCIKENVVLKSIVINVWNSNKYYELYNSYLLESITKDEFTKLLPKYAKPFSNGTDEEIAFVSNLCMTVLGSNLVTSDINQLTNFPHNRIDNALSKNPLFTNLLEIES